MHRRLRGNVNENGHYSPLRPNPLRVSDMSPALRSDLQYQFFCSLYLIPIALPDHEATKAQPQILEIVTRMK